MNLFGYLRIAWNWRVWVVGIDTGWLYKEFDYQIMVHIGPFKIVVFLTNTEGR